MSQRELEENITCDHEEAQSSKKLRLSSRDDIAIPQASTNIQNKFTQLANLAQQSMERCLQALLQEIDCIQMRSKVIAESDEYLDNQIEQHYRSSSTESSSSINALLPTELSEVNVNFGGKCLTLDRNVICNPKIKYNFFSALFHPRWQRVLPKDKEGRLYFELEYKWIQSILDAYEVAYFKSKDAEYGNESISLRTIASKLRVSYLDCIHTSFAIVGHNAHILEIEAGPQWFRSKFIKQALLPHVIGFFHLHDKPTHRILLKHATNDANIPKVYISGDHKSIIFGIFCKWENENQLDKYRFFVMREDENCQDCHRKHFQQNDYVNASSISFNISNEGLNLNIKRGRSFELLFSITTGFGRQCLCPSEWLNSDKDRRMSYNSTFSYYDLELEPYEDIEGLPPSEANLDKVFQESLLQPSATTSKGQTRLDLDDCFDEYSNIIAIAKEGFQEHNFALASHLKFKCAEATFIKTFLASHRLVQRDVYRSCTPSGLSEAELPQYIHEAYDSIAEYARLEKHQAFQNLIIWFNVRGESVCLLKSTIIEVIPSSQLAIRVGGNWVEQASALDKQGRIIVVCTY
jgi:hypothetical protein